MIARFLVVPFLAFFALLAACAAPTPTSVPPTLVRPTIVPTVAPAPATANLADIKIYLLDKTAQLKTDSNALAEASYHYYDLAKSANFDYAALWQTKRQTVTETLLNARTAWENASPTYEQMEGIVAGVPSLSHFDVNLDAGTSGTGADAVTFDLTLPDGRKLVKPGNLFGVTEETLWGSNPDYASKVKADFNGNGKDDLGDVLPDANVLQASTELLNVMAGQLDAAASVWEPTDSDAFSALVGNVPTVGDFFESWKTSRFVLGDQATHQDFAVISRLSDIIDNVSSWQAIYAGVSPMVAHVDAAQDQQIRKGLSDLKAYVSDIYQKEQAGKHYAPEEADLLSAEAQNRATAIAGELAQAAAKLNIKVTE